MSLTTDCDDSQFGLNRGHQVFQPFLFHILDTFLSSSNFELIPLF